MLRHILDQPGVNKTQMCLQFNIAWGTCTYHVEVLERKQRIQRVELGRQVHLFSRDVDYHYARRWSALLHPHAAQLILVMGSDRQSSIQEIMNRTRLGRRLISNRLEELQAVGLVDCYGAGRKRYRASRAALEMARELK